MVAMGRDSCYDGIFIPLFPRRKSLSRQLTIQPRHPQINVMKEWPPFPCDDGFLGRPGRGGEKHVMKSYFVFSAFALFPEPSSRCPLPHPGCRPPSAHPPTARRTPQPAHRYNSYIMIFYEQGYLQPGAFAGANPRNIFFK